MVKSTYYWRAVRRIAKRLDISIPAARKKDWQKEARAEFKRRSEAHVSTGKRQRHSRDSEPKRKPDKHVGVGIRGPKRKRHPAKRILPPTESRSITPAPIRELEDEEEYGGGDYVPEDEFTEEWVEEWQDDYPTLDSLDDLEDFLQDFEYEDSDKYKEPS